MYIGASSSRVHRHIKYTPSTSLSTLSFSMSIVYIAVENPVNRGHNILFWYV